MSESEKEKKKKKKKKRKDKHANHVGPLKVAGDSEPGVARFPDSPPVLAIPRGSSRLVKDVEEHLPCTFRRVFFFSVRRRNERTLTRREGASDVGRCPARQQSAPRGAASRRPQRKHAAQTAHERPISWTAFAERRQEGKKMSKNRVRAFFLFTSTSSSPFSTLL